jgi:hypothetical protein
MEQAASTDDRLNLLAQKVDAGFARMDAKFEQIDSNFDRVDRDIRELRDVIFRFGGRITFALVGVILALIGVIGAILASG